MKAFIKVNGFSGREWVTGRQLAIGEGAEAGNYGGNQKGNGRIHTCFTSHLADQDINARPEDIAQSEEQQHG